MGYKLHYFGIRGRAEPIRLLLADNGIEFEDHRIQADEWPELKGKFQFGQVPCLSDGEHEIPQSGAIIRHLARKHGLSGETECQATYADVFGEGIRDLHTAYATMIYRNYEEGKRPFIEQTLPTELEKVEKLFKSKEGGEKFVCGEKLTYTDYLLFDELDILLVLDPSCLDKFPALKAFHDRFAERPKLKAYIEKRNADKVLINGNGKQ